MKSFYHIPDTNTERAELIKQILETAPKTCRLQMTYLIVLVQEQERRALED